MVELPDHSDAVLCRIAQDYGTPFYAYSMPDCLRQIAALREGFRNRFLISYAVKSNPNPGVVARLRERVDLLDISSGGELKMCLGVGWPADRLTFTGPGKSDEELRLAVSSGIGAVIVESVREAERLDRIAAEREIRQPILLRIAPLKVPRGFGVRMAGKPCQFGIDEEVMDDAVRHVRRLKCVRLDGFHIYAGTQCLAVDALSENFSNYMSIFRRICDTHDITPASLVFGTGIGIPHHAGDVSVDLEPVAESTVPEVDAMRSVKRFANTGFILESGRFLIGEAGTYVVSVVSIKNSRGARIVICDGGMNQHLAACGHFGTVVHRNYRIRRLRRDATPVPPLLNPVDLVGPLCTSIDTLGHNVELPELDPGDLIAVSASGAYGLSASPMHFISHTPPREILIEQDASGGIELHDVSQYR